MMIDVLSNRLSKGDRIEILGLGSIALNCKPPRQGRNPKTGTKVMVPSKYMPHFNARKELNGCVVKDGS
jgi:integration host factor subunit beta